MEIITKLSPNFKPGRKGRKIIAIINHITAGKFPGCLSWLCNPAAKASANYLVTRAGQIYQLVKDTDTAYHAGIVNRPNWPLYDGTNPNRYTIGIEYEDYTGDGELGLTEAQYQASLWLHKYLIKKWNIPIDQNHIIGHNRLDTINRRNDPGPGFPWQRLFADLKGQSTISPAYKTAIEKMVAKKMLSNGAYWLSYANSEVKGEWMAILLKNVTGKSDLQSAIATLVQIGAIGSPDYWLQNCVAGKIVAGQYVQTLVINAVQKLGI